MAEAALARAATETAVADAAEARTAQQAAETAQAAAEMARIAAEDNADAQVALAETANMAVQVADAAVVQANADLMEARAKQKEAEDAQAAAETAEATARRQLEAALRATTAEEQRRIAAEQEQDRLAQVAEDAQQKLDAAAAMKALAGDRMIGDDADLAVTPMYRKAASIQMPNLTGTGSTSSAGRWLRTTHSDADAATRDTVVIYSDVGAPTREDFATGYTGVIDGAGMVIGFVTIDSDNHGTLVASSSFPRSPGRAVTQRVRDRGPTKSQIDAIPDDDITGTGRDEVRYPTRYSVELSGSLQGASGRFRCGGADAEALCTVQNRGGSFFFGGIWQFTPSSGTVKILVDDAEFMWFGWWSRYTVSDDSWDFQAKHGGTEVPGVSEVTGTATYNGRAAGHYAVHEPISGASDLGEFTATARLEANFGEVNTISGTISNFSNASGWTLSLNGGAITESAGTFIGTDVTWSINGARDDGGAWEGAFYSDLPMGETEGVQPYGVAGTFEAAHGTTGRLIGAFGAHR